MRWLKGGKNRTGRVVGVLLGVLAVALIFGLPLLLASFDRFAARQLEHTHWWTLDQPGRGASVVVQHQLVSGEKPDPARPGEVLMWNPLSISETDRCVAEGCPLLGGSADDGDAWWIVKGNDGGAGGQFGVTKDGEFVADARQPPIAYRVNPKQKPGSKVTLKFLYSNRGTSRAADPDFWTTPSVVPVQGPPVKE